MSSIYLYFFVASLLIIFWAMIGYPFSIKLIGKIYLNKKNEKNYSYQPTVTVLVTAHNEEKVIKNKLLNLFELKYPKDKLTFMVTSDHSTDATNDIVKQMVEQYPEMNIVLYEVKERKGKTNAQNEAYKLISSEFIVMTDANSMLHENAVKELMSSFTSRDIAYVTGKLELINSDISDVSNAESGYWNKDLSIREIESNIHSVTAGNGALYACRTSDYIIFNPIQSHDTAMPFYYTMNGKRAIANHNAIAYEKAGEVVEDEYKRKVRMNRLILKHILPDIRILNIFKYKWFTYFYLGHRSSRYLLWLSHLILLLSSIFLMKTSIYFIILVLGQVVFYVLATLKHILKIENRLITLIYYYTVTVIAQWHGVVNIVTGKSKPFWEKAESTR